jgi:hypothetical protein
VRAYAYIRTLGAEGLRRVSTMAVLNANYLRVKMKEAGYRIAFDRINMHEFVAQPPAGLRTLDIAKALLDYGLHPMTVYFPLVVKEAMMVEPTETSRSRRSTPTRRCSATSWSARRPIPTTWPARPGTRRCAASTRRRRRASRSSSTPSRSD